MTTFLPHAYEADDTNHRIPPLIADLHIEGEQVSVVIELSHQAKRELLLSVIKALAWQHLDVIDVQTMPAEQADEQLGRLLRQHSVQEALHFGIDPTDAKILAMTLDAAEYEPKECVVTGCENLALPLEEWCNAHLRERR